MTLDDDLVKKVETASQMSFKQRALDLHERGGLWTEQQPVCSEKKLMNVEHRRINAFCLL
jgi:hypothetical protein